MAILSNIDTAYVEQDRHRAPEMDYVWDRLLCSNRWSDAGTVEEAAARTSERIGTDPGDCSMTWHGLIQPPATGAQPAATDPRAPMVISEADRAAFACAQRLKGCAEASLSGPSMSTASPNGGGHAIADISRKLKSP